MFVKFPQIILNTFPPPTRNLLCQWCCYRFSSSRSLPFSSCVLFLPIWWMLFLSKKKLCWLLCWFFFLLPSVYVRMYDFYINRIFNVYLTTTNFSCFLRSLSLSFSRLLALVISHNATSARQIKTLVLVLYCFPSLPYAHVINIDIEMERKHNILLKLYYVIIGKLKS